jgi:two-component system NarL family sensor kinase
VPASPTGTWWIFLTAALALGVILFALGAALVIYQRRFLGLHRTYAKNLLNAHEEERAWVAREVHDDALQRVAMLAHELNDWSEEQGMTPERQHHRIDALRDELQDLAVMLRRVAHRLHPALIEHAGLGAALESLAVDISRSSGVQIDVNGASVQHLTLSREHALLLYRIAQEALRNVVKHSGVKDAKLTVALNDRSIQLTIADKGRGFVADDTARSRGLGLISMAERARLADGRLEVWSQPGGGTTVRATVPLDGV